MFAVRPNTLIYIQRSGLLATGKHIEPVRLDFGEALVKNLEILLREKFIQTAATWIRDVGVHGKRIIIVLDPSVLFEKTIKLDQSGQPDTLTQGFIDAVPFPAGQRACLSVQTSASLQLYATNADLYRAVSEALRSADAGKLIAITPSTAYNLSGDERTISAASARFFNDATVMRQANFLEARVS